MTGILYGVGLGPGDPELMTLKAHRLISDATAIAYPAPMGGDSFARSIAADVISQNAQEIRIDIPMDVARYPAQEAYDNAAQEISNVLKTGQDVVVLCEGDPLFYGSFMYLFARLSGRFEVEVIPGVTSVTAVAAALQRPLSARNEVLTIIPGTLDEKDLADRVAAADALAIMKVGRHLPKIRRVLETQGLWEHAGYVERATLANQRIAPLSEAPDKAPYFSMILVTKGADPWLS